MFLLKLAVATGWTIEYVESLPETIMLELQALNSLSPFTHEAQANRDGLIASILFNKDVSKKKNMKSPSDLIPYLKPGTPEWLKDDVVKKAESLIKAADIHRSFGEDAYDNTIKVIKEKIQEQIEIEESKKKVDRYRVSELKKLI